MVTIKEKRTGKLMTVSRQYAEVFLRLGKHVKVEREKEEPLRKIVADTAIEKANKPKPTARKRAKKTSRKKAN